MRFCQGQQNIETMRQIADNFAQNHTGCKAAVGCSYDYLKSHERIPQDGCVKICKTVARQSDTSYSCRTAAVPPLCDFQL